MRVERVDVTGAGGKNPAGGPGSRQAVQPLVGRLPMLGGVRPS